MLVENILGSKSKVKLLRIFYDNPNREFTLYEIKKTFNLSTGTINPVLKSLVNNRALLSRRVGKSILYQLNSNNLIVKKTVEIFESERTLLFEKAKEVAKKIEKSDILSIVLFGSVATGKITELSDIDILIVYKSKYHIVKANIGKLIEKYLEQEILISPIILSKNEVIEMLNKYDSFILRVQDEGKTLYGKSLEGIRHG
ncbi:MAG: nucleotidyltransferase domain-containing protein [Candidatus Aenigmarchaeota archaeon]|nr:nucleotidyltransferase domain-containing protein [Candidatus Aenigmarchaeota archaeon]